MEPSQTPMSTSPPISEYAAQASNEASQMLACASDTIRKNPLPSVAAAAAFGIAIGYLIASGRHEPTFQERYVTEPLDQAAESIGSSFGRLYGNLKFW